MNIDFDFELEKIQSTLIDYRLLTRNELIGLLKSYEDLAEIRKEQIEIRTEQVELGKECIASLREVIIALQDLLDHMGIKTIPLE